jgi:hypothetical protein
VAKPTKDKRKVDNDPLADLGLDTTTTQIVEQPVTQAAPTAAAPTAPATNLEASDGGNEEVEVGEIEFGFSEYIPTASRKPEGSKYKFDKLPAPTTKDGKPRIANFFVKLQPGVDPDKLRRSVQSATTQANRQGSDAGKYFVSRTVTEDGVFKGMTVYRTDKPKK